MSVRACVRAYVCVGVWLFLLVLFYVVWMNRYGPVLFFQLNTVTFEHLPRGLASFVTVFSGYLGRRHNTFLHKRILKQK